MRFVGHVYASEPRSKFNIIIPIWHQLFGPDRVCLQVSPTMQIYLKQKLQFTNIEPIKSV